MTPEQFGHVRILFREAQLLGGAAREALLQGEADTAVLDEVRKLLDADASESDFLAEPALGHGFSVGAAAQGSPVGLAGERLGAYRVRRLIAEGGMGAVYEAEQDRPARVVALKVLRPTSSRSEAARRFRLEAELLGRLEHPNIAPIIEAGSGVIRDSSYAFLALAMVSGACSILDYGERARLRVHQRVQLAIKVCAGLQHAHLRGVIHRDLKPSNILVGDDGEPKLIDFGVATAQDIDLGTLAPNTQTGELVGTVLYMSPEQCEGRSHLSDVRSDVYSFGVVLYELLTGALPYPIKAAALPEALRAITEHAVVPPSAVSPDVRGDLETIVLKSLARDPGDRYQSAGELADDLARWLRHEPVRARPPTIIGRFVSSVRRRPWQFAVAALAVAFLLAAAIGSALYRSWSEAEGARGEADRARTIAEGARSEAERLARRQSLMAAQEAIRGGDARAGRAAMTGLAPGHPGSEVPWEELDWRNAAWEVRHYAGCMDDAISIAARLETPAQAACWLGAGGLLAVGGADELRIIKVSEDGACHTLTTYGFADLTGDRRIGLGPDPSRPRVVAAPSNTAAPHFVHLAADSAGRRLLVNHQSCYAIFDVDTNGAVTTLAAWSHSVVSGGACALSPDGSLAVTVHDGEVRCLRVSAKPAPRVDFLGQCRIGQDDLEIADIAFSPDSTKLAIGAADWSTKIVGVAQLLDACCGQSDAVLPSVSLEGHRGKVRGVAWSHAGTELATASLDGTARVWRIPASIEPGQAAIRATAVLDALGDPLTRVTWLADGRIAVPTRSFGLRIWGGIEPESMRAPGAAPRQSTPQPHQVALLLGQEDSIQALSCHPQLPLVATASLDGTIRIWSGHDLGAALIVRGHTSSVVDAAFLPGSRYFVTGGGEGLLGIWDAKQGGECLGLVRVSDVRVRGVVAHPVLPMVVACGDSADLRQEMPDAPRATIWDLADPGRPLLRAIVRSGGSIITALAMSPDGHMLAAGDAAGRIECWQLDSTGLPIGAPSRASLSGFVLALAFSPTSQVLAASLDTSDAGGPSLAVLRSQSSLGEVRVIPLDAAAMAVAFRPDMPDRLLAGCKDGSVRELDAHSMQWLPRQSRLGNSPVNALAIHPSGRRVAVGVNLGSASILDADSLREVAAFPKTVVPLCQLAFSPDGRLLAGAYSGLLGHDNIVRLWSAEDGPTRRQNAWRQARFAATVDDLLDRMWADPPPEAELDAAIKAAPPVGSFDALRFAVVEQLVERRLAPAVEEVLDGPAPTEGDLEIARQQVSRAAEYRPDDPHVLDLVARLDLKAGRWASAYDALVHLEAIRRERHGMAPRAIDLARMAVAAAHLKRSAEVDRLLTESDRVMSVVPEVVLEVRALQENARSTLAAGTGVEPATGVAGENR